MVGEPARVLCFLVLGSVGLGGADPAWQPVRVCEVLEDLGAYQGKVTVILGRFSFRGTGRFLSEETCDRNPTADEPVRPNVVRVVIDPKSAPKPPQPLEIDATIVYRKLKLVKKHTSLGKFRFGSADYDRWAVIYGRIEPGQALRKEESKPSGGQNRGLEPASAQVVCGGEGVIVFIADE